MLASIILLIVGTALLYLAYLQHKTFTTWLKRANSTKAEVIRIEGDFRGQEYGGTRTDQGVFPVFRYTDTNDQTHEMRSRTSITRSKVEHGKIMDILYDPDRPDDVRIGSSTDRYLTIVLSTLGVVLIIVAFKFSMD